ncbi:unnamed protein product [Hermetia illucens]|uniref:Uncharacterized protein n=1 Tax=Hermetia illucens TaxID=343691 RepID=A0A7R8YSZ8_HERIL|nr:unnamed protein product [Hermetia illucens]
MFSRGRGDNSASSGGAGAGYAGAGHPVESGPRARLNDYRDAANTPGSCRPERQLLRESTTATDRAR